MFPNALERVRRPLTPSRPMTTGVPAGQGATVVDALTANAARGPDRTAMRYRDDSGEWRRISWAEYQRAAREVAAGLVELGFVPGSRVAILADNGPAWHMIDMGALTAGGVTVPVYPTSSSEQVAYALGHSQAEVCFVDSHTQLGKVLEKRSELPQLRRIVLLSGLRRSGDVDLISFEELRAIGSGALDRDPASGRVRGSAPDDLATIVYTSGTTGPPKGAMLTHGNIMWALRQVTPVYGVGEGDRLLSFLPLSHIAERMMSEFMPIAVTGQTWFARSLATVAEDLPACRPTIFLAVPRVWEKLRERVERELAAQTPVVRMSAERYIEMGLRRVAAEQEDQPPNWPLAALHQALDRTVGAALRHRIGLDRARIVVSAAAPIHPDLVRWFSAIGLPLQQIYGQTEDCGPTTATRLEDNRIGTVGRPLPGISVQIGPDSEILVKGGHVCLGYLDDPDATAALIDAAGWMHTGDTGIFDADGSLRIVGRKKDLIITAGGQNIAPQDIETDLCNEPLVAEAVVVGDGRRYLGALLALDPEALSKWAVDHNKLDDYGALTTDPDLIAEIGEAVERVNSHRSHAEGIRKFRILPHELTARAGELTPTMKVKRHLIYDRYAPVIDELYSGTQEPVAS